MPKFSVSGIWQRWRESYQKDGTKLDDAITVFTGVSQVLDTLMVMFLLCLRNIYFLGLLLHYMGHFWFLPLNFMIFPMVTVLHLQGTFFYVCAH